MTTLTIKNLIKRTTIIQEMMTLSLIQAASRSQETFQVYLNDLKTNLFESANSIDRILQDREKSPADLSIRSRRAYQWIKHLSNDVNLREHLDALQRINLFLPQIKKPGLFKKHRVDFVFFHLGSLYKIQRKNSSLEITAQECFITAPDNVLIALLKVALEKKDSNSLQDIRNYTFSPTYQAARESLEYLDIPPDSYAVGSEFNLLDSYSRVNEIYFQGDLDKPHLVWSNRLTFRKFGHYQWDTNTVMISRTLDQPRMPAYVLDYVMFHELLHKKMGLKLVNQHRFAHTHAFRVEERKFKQFKEAQQKLNKITKKA